ncbi:hypothetical protein J2X12_002930 [Pseudarthrobacter oxydans]|uniref:Uncharacterized protein n=1 Tax=Pseudarthrobacter oxydans TaxID=1671 RepID=A0AAW8NC81_PSEOX|nr:hypothetical protein [Pseudarthrobacter oxydans]MDR6794333.1 hypothetical protein [Pseudarthrobacter oxydans]MDR7164892.1 hypothetical protein [Pseudarthrobacter oxydans]
MTSITDTLTNKAAGQMLLALNRAANGISGRNLQHIYAGTVSPAIIAKRRAKNSAARKARRASR